MCPRYMNVPSPAPCHVNVAGVGKQSVWGLRIIACSSILTVTSFLKFVNTQKVVAWLVVLAPRDHYSVGLGKSESGAGCVELCNEIIVLRLKLSPNSARKFPLRGARCSIRARVAVL